MVRDGLAVVGATGRVHNLVFLEMPDRVVVEAKGDIEVGEEIFVTYGEQYWEGRELS